MLSMALSDNWKACSLFDVVKMNVMEVICAGKDTKASSPVHTDNDLSSAPNQQTPFYLLSFFLFQFKTCIGSSRKFFRNGLWMKLSLHVKRAYKRTNALIAFWLDILKEESECERKSLLGRQLQKHSMGRKTVT